MRRVTVATERGPVRYSPAEAILLAPIPEPPKIICLGLNDRDHAAESGMDVLIEPVIFNKFATTLLGHGASIVLPKVSRVVDYKAELVAVIGRGVRHIPQSQAREHVAD